MPEKYQRVLLYGFVIVFSLVVGYVTLQARLEFCANNGITDWFQCLLIFG